MNSLQVFVVLILVFVSVSRGEKFPPHNESDDRIIFNDWEAYRHKDDDPACGLFKTSDGRSLSSPSDLHGRVYNGENASVGQFPWEVCLIKPLGRLRHSDGWMVRIDSNDPPDIWDYGYRFSNYKDDNLRYEDIRSWSQFCTGTIIHENWILTAAHCLTKFWEGMFFIVSAGTFECMTEKFHDNMREVVTYREKGSPHRTIFEHPGWFSEYKGSREHDVALVRLREGYNLPRGVYNGESLNRICLYSTQDLPKFGPGCLKNVYYAGYGMKGVEGEGTWDYAYLTWARFWKGSTHFCNTMARQDLLPKPEWCESCQSKFQHMWCFTTVPDDQYQKAVAADTNGTSLKFHQLGFKWEDFQDIPNICVGDSGGAFIYYMRDETSDSNNNQQNYKYRALLLSTVYGADVLPQEGRECFAEHHQLDWRGKYFKVNTLGPVIHEFTSRKWWKDTMNTDTNNAGRPPLVSISRTYPSVWYRNKRSSGFPDYGNRSKK